MKMIVHQRPSENTPAETSGHAAQDGYADQLHGPMLGLQQAMDLTWRMLGVWLTVLALLLLVGVIV